MPVDELRHVLDDSDAKVVIHVPDVAKPMRTAAKRIPKPWRPQLLEVGEAYEQALVTATRTAGSARDAPAVTPDGSDLVFLYTGGGTGGGLPSAVMWRNDDLYRGLVGKHTGIVLPVAPLTHSTGLFSAIAALIAGGTVVLLDARADAAARVERGRARARHDACPRR